MSFYKNRKTTLGKKEPEPNLKENEEDESTECSRIKAGLSSRTLITGPSVNLVKNMDRVFACICINI